MESKHKYDWYIITVLWIALIAGIKLAEYQRAYKDLEVGFRYDLFVLLPALVVYTIYVFWKNRHDLDDD